MTDHKPEPAKEPIHPTTDEVGEMLREDGTPWLREDGSPVLREREEDGNAGH